MTEPQYKINDTVKYQGRQGKVIEVFQETNRPIKWRYIVSLRTGDWSVPENHIEKKVKDANE